MALTRIAKPSKLTRGDVDGWMDGGFFMGWRARAVLALDLHTA